MLTLSKVKSTTIELPKMKIGKVITESIHLTLNALQANKLRSFLSVLGVTIGISCIVAIFTATHSLEQNIRVNVDKMGDNIVYVQKMPWVFGARTPWWEFNSRPQASEKEYRRIKRERDKSVVKDIAFFYDFGNNTLKSEMAEISSVRATAISGEFFEINKWELAYGRTFNNFEIEKGGNSVILGYNVAKGLFAGSNPVGKSIKFNGHSVSIIGILKYQGSNIGGSQYDDIAVLSSVFAQKFANPKNNKDLNTSIVLKGYPETDIKYLDFEIKRLMRSIRRLKPKDKDNFAINKLTMVSNQLDQTFGMIDIAAFLIGGFSLLVGGFGIANIMFVSVKERTAIIGLQKALGAKRSFILTQFLFEAVLLCVIGAVLGIIIVAGAGAAASYFTSFQIFYSTNIFITGISIAIFIGLIAGIAPALMASRMDPVVALRK